MHERRYKIANVMMDQVLLALAGVEPPCEKLRGCRFVDLEHVRDPHLPMLRIKVWHPDFEPVAEGAVIPELFDPA